MLRNLSTRLPQILDLTKHLWRSMPCWLSAELTIFWNNVQGLGGDTSTYWGWPVSWHCRCKCHRITYCSLIELEDHMIGAAIWAIWGAVEKENYQSTILTQNVWIGSSYNPFLFLGYRSTKNIKSWLHTTFWQIDYRNFVRFSNMWGWVAQLPL